MWLLLWFIICSDIGLVLLGNGVMGVKLYSIYMVSRGRIRCFMVGIWVGVWD